MTTAGTVRYAIEPFDSDKHDRTAFSCGVPQIDNYFQKTAGKLFRADNIRLFVMTAPDGQLIGFYSLNAHVIDYAELPKKYHRTRPAHGDIPAAFISMMARDKRSSGQGFGGILLINALKRVAFAADAIGIAVVRLDVFDCGDPERVARRKALYETFGFTALPSNPLRLYLPISAVRDLVTGAEGLTSPG